jgi:hypothetical protein
MPSSQFLGTCVCELGSSEPLHLHMDGPLGAQATGLDDDALPKHMLDAEYSLYHKHQLECCGYR